ncbi:hypothetical protein ACP4OV_003206 [Aristida adscensionis]
MAIPVARVHLAMAHAALPGLLPTPPLPAPPCLLVLPAASPCSKFTAKGKPGRADAVERWDAHKTKHAGNPSSSPPPPPPPPPPPSSSSSTSSCQLSSGSSPGRASSCERWDINKKGQSSASSSSTSSARHQRRAGAAAAAATSAGTAPPQPPPPAGRRRARGGTATSGPVSRASSAERLDTHKKPRPEEVAEGLDAGGSKEMDTPPQQVVYVAPGFVAASPEPCMLPIPSFTLVRAG